MNAVTASLPSRAVARNVYRQLTKGQDVVISMLYSEFRGLDLALGLDLEINTHGFESMPLRSTVVSVRTYCLMIDLTLRHELPF